MKALIATVFLCANLGVASAQASSVQAPPVKATGAPKPAATAKKAAPVRSECAVAGGLCVTVPASWQRLGNVFDDLGFVVAEPHPGADSATWPQLTVAAIEVPPQKDANGTAPSLVAPSLDALVDIVLTPNGSFTSAETLQRTRLMLNGRDAEIVRVLLHDDANKSEAIEAVMLTEGDGGLVYSIALRSAPQDSTRLEPVFQRAVHSWRIKQSAAQPAPQSKPEQDSKRK
jgi:hypothetical protein